MPRGKKSEPEINTNELFATIGDQKGVKKDIIIEAIRQGIVAAYKRENGQAQNVEVTFNEETGQFAVYSVREVVDEVFDSRLEISLEDARAINDLYEVGDKIRFQEELKKFARTSISIAKQNVVRLLREEEQRVVFDEYKKYENEIINGVVERVDEKAIYINLGHVDALLTKHDQLPRERYRIGDRIKTFVSRVDLTTKGVRVYVSRTHPELIKRMIESEVPEVFEGVVEIVNISREAGDRAKVLVRSHDKNVDAVGTVVGGRGARIQAIISELHGENMDVIQWSPDKATLVANVLKPATVSGVLLLKDGSTIAVVADDQLSLAIGKRGQNVRLAAQVANCKIDIKKESEFKPEDYDNLVVGSPDDFDPEFDSEGNPIVVLPDAPEVDLTVSADEQVGLEELLGEVDLTAVKPEEVDGDED